MSPRRILHVLSQRPLLTGSGVALDALVRQAATAGWDQAALVGVPADDRPQVGGLPPERILAVTFASPDGGAVPDLDFPVPGMSDVMPYRSSVWSRMTPAQLAAYREVWTRRLEAARDDFQPELIHTNHLWLVSALVRKVFADIPVVLSCHATGLRQLELCPHLADEVVRGCGDIDRFCVLREDHRERLAAVLDIDPQRITITGAGYNDAIFHPDPATARGPGDILYVGKYSAAKGVPQLLEAFTALALERPGLRLHIAGSGAGPEADRLADRMDAMAPAVVRHGQLGQADLADLMRRCAVCVLPSFYEGVPLVLVEAAACGCRIVATDLPGVREQLAPALGPWLHAVPMPRLETVDRPVAADLPCFVTDLQAGLARALDAAPATPPDLSGFTWGAVAGRIQGIWQELLPGWGPGVQGR